MKSWILLIVVVVAVSATATLAVPLLTASPGKVGPKIAAPSAKPDGPAPKVVVEGDLRYEFGSMAQHTNGKHTWTFRNEGKGPLEVWTMSSTCSCTLAQLGKDSTKRLTIDPGQSAPIDLTWDTKGNDGAYSQSATLGTNDPNRPQISLITSGTVRPPVVVVPNESGITFSTVSNDKPHEFKMAVFSPDRPETKLTRMVTSKPDRVTVEARPLTPEQCKELNAPAGGQMVVVTVLPSSNLGKLREELVIETDHPQRPRMTFPVTATVEGPILMAPARVIMHDASTRGGESVDVTIFSRGQSETKFTVARKPDHLDVSIAPVGAKEPGKNSKYRMTVAVAPSTPPGRIAGEIVLHTDNPHATEVKVPVDVLVRAAD